MRRFAAVAAVKGYSRIGNSHLQLRSRQKTPRCSTRCCRTSAATPWRPRSVELIRQVKTRAGAAVSHVHAQVFDAGDLTTAAASEHTGSPDADRTC